MERSREVVHDAAMRERFDDLGVSLEPPAGWHVRQSVKPRYVALVPDEQREVESASLVGALSIQFAPPGDLDTASTAAMRRYVGQDRSTYARVVVDERTAHRHLWTDGVRSTVTWFLQARDRVLEIHVDVDGFRAAPWAELELGARLLPCICLDAPLPPEPRSPVRIPHPCDDRMVELAGARVDAVRRLGRVVEVEVTTLLDERFVLRFRGALGVLEGNAGQIAGLVQLDESEATSAGIASAGSSDARTLVVFAFLAASDGVIAIAVACEAAELEVTADLISR